ncbi:hypothetical protein [Actinomadura sp. KC06]|uniref:hypothetical protein n=1 Tax=Actinomadura sp. KC06 TaxID=2530369 RepID=UPI001404C7CE|nr:hypothetical protein [Actinomadura sp. KC06]
MPGERVTQESGGPVAMLREYLFAMPDEDHGRLLAADLADREIAGCGCGRCTLPHLDPANPLFGKPEFSRPELQGWWQVSSMVDELAIDDAAASHQRECEKFAVAALARSHRGFCEGGSIAHRETMLRLLNLDGLLHDLPQEQAYERRVAVTRSFPAPRDVPAPTVAAAAPTTSGLPSLLDTVRAVASRLETDGAATQMISWWLTDEAAQFENDQELLFELSDAVLHQGTCSPHTAEQIPLLAGLIEHEQVAAPFRAFLLLLLAEAGTVGRRLAAQDADRRSALGTWLRPESGRNGSAERRRSCRPRAAAPLAKRVRSRPGRAGLPRRRLPRQRAHRRHHRADRRDGRDQPRAPPCRDAPPRTRPGISRRSSTPHHLLRGDRQHTH